MTSFKWVEELASQYRNRFIDLVHVCIPLWKFQNVDKMNWKPSPTEILSLILLLPSTFVFRHFYLSQMSTYHELLRKSMCAFSSFVLCVCANKQNNWQLKNSVFFYCGVPFGNSSMDALELVSPLDWHVWNSHKVFYLNTFV